MSHVNHSDDVALLPAENLVLELERLAKEGFNDPNPIGHSSGYMALVERKIRVREELLRRLRSADVIYCQGCGDGMEPDPVPSLCIGCVNEALHLGVDPDPEELRAARLEQEASNPAKRPP